jgi:hypothetical protein
MSNPPTFEAANLEAHRDGDSVLIEIRTRANITMVFRVDPQTAIEAAHQIERAFHQLQRRAQG